jgi:hypothetical protein
MYLKNKTIKTKKNNNKKTTTKKTTKNQEELSAYKTSKLMV